jgi:hypothetical protein
MTSANQPSPKVFMYVAIAGVMILFLYLLVIVDTHWLSNTNVIVSVEQQQRIVSEFENTWQRKPSEAEMDDLIKTFARQEIAWREAARLSLGSNDADIRRRMQQHLELLAAEEAGRAHPTPEELHLFLSEHANEFRVDPFITFRQIYFDNTDNVIGADASARYILGRLQNQPMPEDISSLGDPSPLPTYLEKVPGSEITTIFGADFVAELAIAPTGEWVGPVSSKLGLHVVYVDDRIAGRIPGLAEVRDAVEEKWAAAQRTAAIEDMYQRLEERYRVTKE